VLGILTALGAALCWAIAPTLFSVGLRDISSPFLANIIRISVAGVFSLICAVIWENFWEQLPFDLAPVIFLIALTLLGTGFGDWLYFKCLKLTELSFVIGISNIYPLFVALFAILFGTERLTPLAILASITIVSGVLLISKTKYMTDSQLKNNPLSTPKSTSKIYTTPIALMILAAFTWGIMMFGLGLSLQYFAPFSINAIRYLAVGVLLLVTFIHPSAKNETHNQPAFSLSLIVIGAVIGPGIGSWLMLVSFELLGTTRSSALFSVSPLFTALIAIIVLKENPTFTRLGGILLVCLGVLLISIS